jgi:hypothetical protein
VGTYSGGVSHPDHGAGLPPKGDPSAATQVSEPSSFRTDARSRRRRMLPVAATGLVAVVGTLYLRAVDPNVPGHYPGCPSQTFLGVDCPGCGGMRGTYDLLHGDVAGMLDHNILLVVALPVAVIAFIVWAFRAWMGRYPRYSPSVQAQRSRWMVIALVLVLAFGVVRNLVPYLGSGAG